MAYTKEEMSRVLPEKPIRSHLLEKFPEFCGHTEVPCRFHIILLLVPILSNAHHNLNN